MSDLNLLWWQAAGTALENFVTAATAIAIRNDPRPMVSALEMLAWPIGGPLPPIDALEVDKQVSFRGEPAASGLAPAAGRLDLVLEARQLGVRVASVWIEVKIDAGETPGQFAAYEARWPLEHPTEPLRLVLLGRSRLEPIRSGSAIPIAFLPWSSLIDAVLATVKADRSWLDLVAFLDERLIAGPTLPPLQPTELADLAALLWPISAAARARDPGDTFAWSSPEAIADNVRWHYAHHHGLVTTGRGSVYGRVKLDGVWQWVVAVDPIEARKRGSNALAVGAASAGGSLGPDWRSVPWSPWSYIRSTPADSLEPDAVMPWLEAGLDDLRRVGFFDRPPGSDSDLGSIGSSVDE